MKRVKGTGGRYVRPVEKIEVDDGHFGRKMALFSVLLVIGLLGIGIGVFSAMTYQPGRTVIEAEGSSTESVASSLVFFYDIGSGEASATADHKALTELYTELCKQAYRIYSADADISGVHNLAYLNKHVGEEVAVSEELYELFELIKEHENRVIYAAPMYNNYRNLFFCEDDAIAATCDPKTSEEVAEYLDAVSKFVADPESVTVELLGEGKVMLKVSDAYASFAEEWGIDRFLDLYWMENAFAVDYVADGLASAGYTSGDVSSYDGFARNLEQRDVSYSLNLFAEVDGKVYNAARYDYSGASTFVTLRGWKLYASDMTYYTYADGRTVHAYVDPTDGRSKNALGELYMYSETKSCAEVLMYAAKVFIADTFEVEALGAAKTHGVNSIWFDGSVICRSDTGAVISSVFEGKDIKFTLE